MLSRTLKTVTLGCRVNQYETEFVRQGLLQLGYRDAADGEPLDLCIVNTCSVTAESEAKCRKIIRRLAKDHPRAEIVVMGCSAARDAQAVAALPGVGEVVADKRELPGFLARRGLKNIPTGIAWFDHRRRAYVKVQDGCRAGCSYCIVPKVRPHLASRPIDEVLDEVRRLLVNGHHEIVLTGVHLGHYGKEWESGRVGEGETDQLDSQEYESPPPPISLSPPLVLLLRRIADLDGDFRVRLSSIEALEVTPELVALMAERRDRICPHLHIPLQSGSDAVLRRMNRRYTATEYLDRCRAIRAALDRPSLTTDVIVGFPGETDADFEATCRVAEQAGFAKIHVFRFSPRAGTPAAEMTPVVPGRIAMLRAAKLGKLGKTLRNRLLTETLGVRQRVLVEGPVPGKPGRMAGTSDHYLPVAVPGTAELIGQFAWVEGRRVSDGRIWGDV